MPTDTSPTSDTVHVTPVSCSPLFQQLLTVFVYCYSDLNRLIMDYLVIEGYKDAADAFSRESGLKPFVDSDSILNRMIIRGAIQRGDVEDAIGRVNELDPEVCSVILHRSSFPFPPLFK